MAVAKAHRLPPGHPPLLRPRRPRHGDRPRRRPARPLHPRRRAGLRRHARSSSTATSPTPSRSTSTPSATARDVHIAGVMEHIEEAGVHSGDSACSLPPYSLDAVTIAELKRQTEPMALALGVVGLMNVQFAIQDDDIYVLEVNPRASPHRPLRRQGHRQRHRRHRRPRHGRRAALRLPAPRPLPRRASAPTTRCPTPTR